MRIGAMQGILRRSGSVLVETAAAIGFDGVELDLRPGNPVFTAEDLQDVRRAAALAGVAIPSLCLGALNGFGFKSPDPAVRERAVEFIRNAIRVAGELGARVVLVPFFGASELFTPEDRERAARGMAGVAPEAERAGVVLAMENTLSAEQDLEMLSAIGSPAVGVYFDVSNAMWWHHNSPDEIRRLGPAIAQIHFKDGSGGHSNAMLGRGHVDYPACVAAMRDIGYDGWVVLESAAPHDPIEDARSNLAFARGLLPT